MKTIGGSDIVSVNPNGLAGLKALREYARAVVQMHGPTSKIPPAAGAYLRGVEDACVAAGLDTSTSCKETIMRGNSTGACFTVLDDDGTCPRSDDHCLGE